METTEEEKVEVWMVPVIDSMNMADIENRPKAKRVYMDKSELVEIQHLTIDDGTASRVGE